MSNRFHCFLFAAVLFLCAVFAHASTSTLTGTITDAQGNPLNGTLTMRLPVPAQDTTLNTAVSPAPVTFNLVNGQIVGGAPLKDVLTLQPSGLYYIARAYDQTGALQFYGNYVVTGATFNLGTAVPTSVTTSNISYGTPVFLSGNNTFTGANTFPYIISATPVPAQTGMLRLANGDQICWRNAGNTADSCQGTPTGFINLIASGTQNLGSAAITAGSCVAVNSTATGAVSGQAVAWAYTNTSPSVSDVKLTVTPLVFPNGVTWNICNPSAGTLTQSGNANVAWRVLQ